MIKNAKIAISLPKENLKRIEKVRKELGLQRSAIIVKAIDYWLDSTEKQNLIKQYQEGYLKHPESLNEIDTLGQLAADAFGEEDLK